MSDNFKYDLEDAREELNGREGSRVVPVTGRSISKLISERRWVVAFLASSPEYEETYKRSRSRGQIHKMMKQVGKVRADASGAANKRRGDDSIQH